MKQILFTLLVLLSSCGMNPAIYTIDSDKKVHPFFNGISEVRIYNGTDSLVNITLLNSDTLINKDIVSDVELTFEMPAGKYDVKYKGVTYNGVPFFIGDKNKFTL